jgi:DNA-binding beta-propeller fold protein YncE
MSTSESRDSTGFTLSPLWVGVGGRWWPSCWLPILIAGATLTVAGPRVVGADAAPPPYQLQWGDQGAGSGEFDTPSGIAVDANGNVFVADRNNNRIQKFTSNGGFITAWGGLGSGPGQFSSPRDVALDASGNVYVADAENDRIQKFTNNGSFILQWGTTGTAPGQFRAPRGLTVDRSGRVYVVEDGFPQKRVQKFTSSGSYLASWGSLGTGDGEFASPRGIAIDSDGYVYVSDTLNHRIEKFTPSGGYIRQWGAEGTGPGQFSFPIGLCWWRSRLYVVDSQNHRVQAFDREGNFVVQWGSHCQLSDSTDCTDSDGAGPLRLGEGQFNYPQGVALLWDGSVFVTDTENGRVVKFSTPTTDVGPDRSPGAIECALASPNPTSGEVVLQLRLPARVDGRGAAYQVRARVLDMAGRQVRDLPARELLPGNQFLHWDGNTASGAAASPGVYVLQVAVDRQIVGSLKLVRLR